MFRSFALSDLSRFFCSASFCRISFSISFPLYFFRVFPASAHLSGFKVRFLFTMQLSLAKCFADYCVSVSMPPSTHLWEVRSCSVQDNRNTGSKLVAVIVVDVSLWKINHSARSRACWNLALGNRARCVCPRTRRSSSENSQIASAYFYFAARKCSLPYSALCKIHSAACSRQHSHEYRRGSHLHHFYLSTAGLQNFPILRRPGTERTF